MPDHVEPAARPAPPERNEPRQTQLYRLIMLVLNIGFLMSVGLILAGIVIAVVRGQTVSEQAEPISDVLPSVARLDAQGIVDLGILVLLVTPVAYVLVSLVMFFRQRDVLFVSVCLVLMTIIGGSIGMALT